MTRTTRHLIAVICALAFSGAGLAGADDATVRKEMLEIFNKAVKDFRNKDVDGFMSMYHTDYRGKMRDGRTQTVKDIRNEMKMFMESTKSVEQATMSIGKLRVMGTNAELVGTIHLKMKVEDSMGAFGKKGAVHDMTMVETTKDTWVRSSGSWKCKASTEIKTDTLVDGKPVKEPPANPPSGKPAHKPSAKARA
jgi:hypothetical protein